MIKIRELPDYLDYGLEVIFIGFNPGLTSAELGHHYAGKSNRFWKLLAESGLTPHQFSPEEDYKLLELDYGLTNIVSRPTRKAAGINKGEYQQGREILKEKLAKFRPRIACYTGIGVYREFSGQGHFSRGLQEKEVVPGVKDFVISSPSGLNRTPYQEQLSRYRELKQLLQQ